jgi:hypothetical protein
MIVWGGNSAGGTLNDGGCYNAPADSWRTITSTGVPTPRGASVAVWTGTDMILWGGVVWGSGAGDSYPNEPHLYNPARNSWRVGTTNGAPAGRQNCLAVWTGTEMIVWGGYAGQSFNDGGRYNPALDSWESVPSTGAPQSHPSQAALWTGTEMIVWGQNSRETYAGRYSPAGGWTTISTDGAPSPRDYSTAVWTGREMIVWGGQYNGGTQYLLNDGARYNPTSDTWRPTGLGGNQPPPRAHHTAMWTGTSMIIWGGIGIDGLANQDGIRYDPLYDWWGGRMSGDGAPPQGPVAVWTGSEMLLWGPTGRPGGLYDPVTDSWTTMPTRGAPVVAPLYNPPPAVWAGSELIVWAGEYDDEWSQGGATWSAGTFSYTPSRVLYLYLRP